MLAFEPSRGFLLVWLLGIILIVVVFVPLAILSLYRLVMAAVKLHRHTNVAMIAAADVKRNTDPAPQLAETLSLIQDILRVGGVVDQHGALLEQVLGRPQEISRR